MTDRIVPWEKDSPQKAGRRAEARAAKKAGARLHPMSGAGRIKQDYSDDQSVTEHKRASKSFTLKLSDVRDAHKNAALQGKTSEWVIEFPGYTLRGTVERTREEEQ